MLSLGKLCQVSQIGVQDLQSEQTLRAIEGVCVCLPVMARAIEGLTYLQSKFRSFRSAVDDRLDIVDAQFRLVGLCKDIIGSHPQYTLQTVEHQVEVLKEHLAPNLSNRPAFAQVGICVHHD